MSNRANRRANQSPRKNREAPHQSKDFNVVDFVIKAAIFIISALLTCSFLFFTFSRLFPTNTTTDDVSASDLPDDTAQSGIGIITHDDYELTGQFALSTLVLGPDSAVLRYYVDVIDFDDLREVANRDGSCILGFSGDFSNFGHFLITADQMISLIDEATAEPNCSGFNLIKTFTSDELPIDIRRAQQELAPGKYLVRSYINPNIASYILSNARDPQNDIFAYPVRINDAKLGIIEIPLTAFLASQQLFAQGQQQSIVYETPFDFNLPSPGSPADGSTSSTGTFI